MVLITGPTGSGKTTTLYAFLQSLNTEDVNIVSLEDPVEYFVSGINQSQVRPEIGYDFASGLRQILRQDPDIIMVGEIRDDETAGLAVQAALTGHVVLSTLHTNNAAGVIPRLIDMKVEPFLMPGIAQPRDRPAPRRRALPGLQSTRSGAAGGAEDHRRARSPTFRRMSLRISRRRIRSITQRDVPRARAAAFWAAPASTRHSRHEGDRGYRERPASPRKRSRRRRKKQGMITLRQDGIVKALKGNRIHRGDHSGNGGGVKKRLYLLTVSAGINAFLTVW